MDKLKELVKEKCSEKEEAQIPVGVVQVKALRRTMTKYYRYVGSLTTPPCTEEVIWTVQRKVRSMTREQLDALRAPLTGEYRKNSRPIQSRNKREVKLYDESKMKKNKDKDKEDENDDDKDEKKEDDKKEKRT